MVGGKVYHRHIDSDFAELNDTSHLTAHALFWQDQRLVGKPHLSGHLQ